MQTNEAFDTKPQVRSKRLNVLPSNPEVGGCSTGAVGPGRFPSWLHRKLPTGSHLSETSAILGEKRLHTVCEEAKCPNRWECWSRHTATFLVMGRECTRACGFCDIATSPTPRPLEEDEPHRIAESVKELGLKHVVITMVARDDIEDGGAAHLAKIVEEIRKSSPEATIELLTSDLSGNSEAWTTVLQAKPEIFNHNIETVRQLTPRVRHKATYDRTLALLHYVKKHRVHPHMYVKSGIMLGLGETEQEVFETIRDLKDVGCDIITIGQYLQPNRRKLLVKAFIPPEQFDKYADYGRSIGIKHMYCGPFVRSSYNADLVLKNILNQETTVFST